MRKRILFLDIDGVLNTDAFCLAQGDAKAINPEPVQLLAEVFAEIDRIDLGMVAEVVISSTWRRDPVWLAEIFAKLVDAGWAHPPIIGRTDPGYDALGRGDEIRNWLVAHYGEDFDRYVVYAIVDDDVFDMLPEQRHQVVECDSAIGFTEQQRDQLRAIFHALMPDEAIEALTHGDDGLPVENIYVFQPDAPEDVRERQMNAIAERFVRDRKKGDADD